MLEIEQMRRFKKDIKKLQKQGKSLNRLKIVINLLVEEEKLAENTRDHALVGNHSRFRECHIAPDWLLIYQVSDDVLKLIRTGSHSELFD